MVQEGAAHTPRAGVADQRSPGWAKRRQHRVSEGQYDRSSRSRALPGDCKTEPTPGRRRRRDSLHLRRSGRGQPRTVASGWNSYSIYHRVASAKSNERRRLGDGKSRRCAVLRIVAVGRGGPRLLERLPIPSPGQLVCQARRLMTVMAVTIGTRSAAECKIIVPGL